MENTALEFLEIIMVLDCQLRGFGIKSAMLLTSHLFLVICSCQIPRHTLPRKPWLNLIGCWYTTDNHILALLMCDVTSLTIYD